MTATLQVPDIEPRWTERQRQVLGLLTRRCTNGEIGQELGIGLDGVKWHINEILQKLNVNSREEAAEYWRYRNGLKMRFLRVARALTWATVVRWAVVGAGAIAVAAAISVGLLLAFGGDGGNEVTGADRGASPTAAPGTPDTSPSPSPSASATASPSAATPATPFPEVTAITHVQVPAGNEIGPGWGLVLGNGLTGGASVWLMPGGTQASGISPSGRYFAWGDSLFDGWTGQRTVVNTASDGMVLASYSHDETLVYVQSGGGSGRVLRLDGNEVARLPEFETANAQAGNANVVWSLDSRGLAVTRYGGGTSRTDVVVDGDLQTVIDSNGMAGWSHEGLRLAVMRDNPAIYDFETGDVVALGASGSYPSWSDDDAYIAIDASAAGQGMLSVLDAGNGDEILRIYNQSACFDIYWGEGRTLPGTAEEVVEVPSGSLISAPASSDSPARRYPTIQGTTEGVEWIDPAGNVYATARPSPETIWAASFAWTRRDIDEWPPALGLGLGGKDACLGWPSAVVVAKPPFSPEQVPTATPTPDK